MIWATPIVRCATAFTLGASAVIGGGTLFWVIWASAIVCLVWSVLPETIARLRAGRRP